MDATTLTVASNSGTIFSGLPSLYNHELPGVNATTVLGDLRRRLSAIKDAFVLTIPPPPVQGLGSAGGFKMMIEDRGGLGYGALVSAARSLVGAANKDPDSRACSRCSTPPRHRCMPDLHGRPAGISKTFFFEKKKQKAFICCRATVRSDATAN